MRIEIPYRRHRCWRIGRLLHHLFFQYTQRGVCLLVAGFQIFETLKSFLSKREMIGTIFWRRAVSLLPAFFFLLRALSLSHAAAITRMNPTFQNTNVGGRKPKFDSEKPIKNAEEITQNHSFVIHLFREFFCGSRWLVVSSVFLKRTFAVGNLRRNDGGSLLLLGDNFGDDLGAGDLGL